MDAITKPREQISTSNVLDKSIVSWEEATKICTEIKEKKLFNQNVQFALCNNSLYIVHSQSVVGEGGFDPISLAYIL